MSTPDKQAAPSEFVDTTMALADVYACTFTKESGRVAYAALRAHLESREALVKQLAEALQEMVGLWADESEFENETAAIQSARAALAAYQEKT